MIDSFEIVEISANYAAICLGIVMSSMLLSFIYNSMVRYFELDHKILVWDFEEMVQDVDESRFESPQKQ